MDGGDVSDADGRTGGSGFDHELAELVGVVRLGSDQSKNELVIGLVEPGRIDDVGDLDSVNEVEDRDARSLHTRHIGDDVELRDLAALHRDGADASDAVERQA